MAANMNGADNYDAKAHFMSRVPTLISLNQLADYAPLDEVSASPPKFDTTSALEAASKPCGSTVASISRTSVPCYLFPANRVTSPPLSAERLAAATANSPGSDADLETNSDASEPDTQVYSAFGEETESASGDFSSASLSDLGQSAFDDILLAHWEDRAEMGLFRYDVTECATKVLPGKLNFVAQLNEGRALKKRPTEYAVDQVAQSFDPSKFNFNKAGVNEVLFSFAGATGISSSKYSEIATNEMAPGANQERYDPNIVVINVSPIEYGHVLLVPSVLSCLEQRITEPTLRLALEMAREADNPSFRIGFNSLGAFATINHLHFQGYYLAARFAVEQASTAPLAAEFVPPPADLNATCPMSADHDEGFGGVHISTLTDYPVRGLCFEVASGSDVPKLATVIAACCGRMHDANVPHNLFVCERGLKAFLFPQCFAERQANGVVPEAVLATGVNPAVFEIAGHMVLKRACDYANASEEWACGILSEVSLDEERFAAVVDLALTGRPILP